MTRAQLEEIRACVEGENLVGQVFCTSPHPATNEPRCYCFVGKLITCFFPDVAEKEDWPTGAMLLDEKLGITMTSIYPINDRAGPDRTSPSPLRAPAVLAYLETLVEEEEPCAS